MAGPYPDIQLDPITEATRPDLGPSASGRVGNPDDLSGLNVLSLLKLLAQKTSGDLLFPGKRQLESKQTDYILRDMQNNAPVHPGLDPAQDITPFNQSIPIRPEAWDAWLASRPLSTNIEDRRGDGLRMYEHRLDPLKGPQ
jgi:hypothetical protein